MRLYLSILLMLTVSVVVEAQTTGARKPVATPTAKPPVAVSAPSSIPNGSVIGGVYKNTFLGFTVPVPDSWTIGTSEFATYMKQKGVDISPKPPKAADLLSQKTVDTNFKRLNILLSAYRSLPGSPQNAMMQIGAEDVRKLNTNRPVNDAVDYVDLMRTQLKSVQMPASYKYSETQAEKLGINQYAYIDTEDGQGKTRIYVTVRKGYAILFSVNYVAEEDLETFRDILARADFALK